MSLQMHQTNGGKCQLGEISHAEISRFRFRRKRNLEISKKTDPAGGGRNYEASKEASAGMPLDAPIRWLRLPVEISKSRKKSSCKGGFGFTRCRETLKWPKTSKSISCHAPDPSRFLVRGQINERKAISTFFAFPRKDASCLRGSQGSLVQVSL